MYILEAAHISAAARVLKAGKSGCCVLLMVLVILGGLC